MLGYGTNTGVPSSSANAGSAISNAAASAVPEGLFGLAAYNPADTNNTDAIMKGANSFVSGANIPAQVAAGMVPAEQAAAYGLNPEIDRNAAASGNVSSSRDAIAHGVLASQLGQQANALTEQLTANAFNTGAGLTESQLASNSSNKLGALTGLTTGGGYAANAGTNANTGSVGQAGGLFHIAGQGSSGITAANQAPLTNQQQQFAANTNDPFAALQNFYNIIGANNWGNQSQGTSTQTFNPSEMSTIGGWMNMAGSLI